MDDDSDLSQINCTGSNMMTETSFKFHRRDLINSVRGVRVLQISVQWQIEISRMEYSAGMSGQLGAHPVQLSITYFCL